ncbi:MAG: hypothetical protein KAS97_03710 [Candidatus Aminicenantes bacterium]|nr:hypothetical protein [Candidatus Aminicenantes bacterium]
MGRILLVLLLILSFSGTNDGSQDDLLKIVTSIKPKYIRQGMEGELSIKILPAQGIKIASNPDIRINLNKNENIQFSKVFFTGSELDFKTIQEDDLVFYDFETDKEGKTISFKVNDASLIGKQKLNGEVVFTATFKDKWSVKTFQKFSAEFVSTRNRNIKKK